MQIKVDDILRPPHSSLIKQALTHRSFIRDKEMKAFESNERLEFLGDSILNLVITEELYKTFPDFLEGHLAKLRSKIVSRKSLAKVAGHIELNRNIYVGRAADMEEVQRQSSVLADTLEAIFGAIYLERGYETIKNIILSLMVCEIEDAVTHDTDYKSRLQELTAQKVRRIPTYRVSEVSGPEHAKWFKCQAVLDGEAIGEGEGPTKKEAQQRAAQQALEKFSQDFSIR